MANYVLSCSGPDIDRAIYFIQNQVAPIFSTTTAYKEGDVVIHEGLLYSCNADISAGAWDASKWTTVRIFDDQGYLILNGGDSGV